MKDNLKNWEAQEVISLLERTYIPKTIGGDYDYKIKAIVLHDNEYKRGVLKYEDGTPIPFSHLKNLNLRGGRHCGCEHDCCGCMTSWSIKSSYSSKLKVNTIIITTHFNY